MARLCLALDYSGQKREANGQFGTGKKPGGSSSSGAKKAEGNGETSSQPAAKARSNYSALKRKTKAQADVMSKAVSSGKASLREAGMQAHIPNTKEYREHAARSAINGYRQGIFTDGYSQYVPGIRQALKDKNAVFKRLQDGSVSAKIDFGADLGIAFGRHDEKGHPVHAVEVRFSKSSNDWHFFPCDMEED